MASDRLNVWWARLAPLALVALATEPAAAAPALPDPVTFAVKVEQGDLETVGTWLDAGLEPNFEGDRIGTGLMIAAWYGNIPMMDLFVRHGADVNRENAFHEQALMLAVWKDRREAAVWLLDRGARINRQGNEWSALHYAAFAGHEELAQYLVQKGADVNARSTNGSTVLMMAAHEGKDAVARMLLAAGADAGAKNDWGEDALTWAMRFGNLTVAKLVTSAEGFAQAAARPRDSWGDAVRPVPAPAEIEKLIQDARVARSLGQTRELNDDDYRRILERVAKMKPAARPARPVAGLSINAIRGSRREWAELQFGE